MGQVDQDSQQEREREDDRQEGEDPPRATPSGG
jgi:hypothetical protein